MTYLVFMKGKHNMAKMVVVDKQLDIEEKIRAKWDMLYSKGRRPHDLPDTYEEFRDGVLKIQQLFFSINRGMFDTTHICNEHLNPDDFSP